MATREHRTHIASADLGRLLVVMDFDGTITLDDCMDVVMAAHVPSWPEFEAAVQRGRLTQVAAFERATRLLRASRTVVLADFVVAAELRPGFREFLTGLLDGRARAVVISAGFRAGIEAVWRREGLPTIPVCAASLDAGEAGGLEMVLDERFGDCPVCGPGHCKAAVVSALRRRGDVVVAFGDGVRDLCMARAADHVFARAALARLCEREGVPWTPLERFDDAAEALRAR
jgi:HAD superfamily phosphoserine phosphatase-like hydrolase